MVIFWLVVGFVLATACALILLDHLNQKRKRQRELLGIQERAAADDVARFIGTLPRGEGGLSKEEVRNLADKMVRFFGQFDGTDAKILRDTAKKAFFRGELPPAVTEEDLEYQPLVRSIGRVMAQLQRRHNAAVA